MRGSSRRAALGFTYLGILFAVAIIGIGLAGIGTVWRTTVQREREQELLFIGHEYRRALARYYAAAGGVYRYPHTLEELLNYQRFPEPRHHLRRLYRDPMTGQADWGLVLTVDGGIMGVHSTSAAKPLKQANFDLADASFALAESYSEWEFIYQPKRGTVPRPLKKG